MQRRTSIVTIVIGLAVALCVSEMALASGEIKIVSPDGDVEFKFLLQKSGLKYEVTFRDRPVIETSPMGITVDGVNLAEGVEAGKVDRYRVKETYPCRGVHSRAVNHCDGATIRSRSSCAPAVASLLASRRIKEVCGTLGQEGDPCNSCRV